MIIILYDFLLNIWIYCINMFIAYYVTRNLIKILKKNISQRNQTNLSIKVSMAISRITVVLVRH